MAYYPIVNRNQHQNGWSGHLQLPDFYMEDFSVVGLCVNDCDMAATILQRHQFVLKPANDAMTVNIENAFQAITAVGLLNENGVACELADVAQGMYQG
jgi:hypothetical protein